MDPYLVRRIEDVAGKELYRRDPTVKREIEIPEEVFERVIRGLTGVVAEDRGTGRVARGAGVPVAGKTGTAQVVRLQEVQDDEEEVPYELRDHGWFAAFAPVETPKIVAAVVVEHGGHGSTSAAPIVTRLIKMYGELYPLAEPAPNLEEEVQ